MEGRGRTSEWEELEWRGGAGRVSGRSWSERAELRGGAGRGREG